MPIYRSFNLNLLLTYLTDDLKIRNLTTIYRKGKHHNRALHNLNFKAYSQTITEFRYQLTFIHMHNATLYLPALKLGNKTRRRGNADLKCLNQVNPKTQHKIQTLILSISQA